MKYRCDHGITKCIDLCGRVFDLMEQEEEIPEDSKEHIDQCVGNVTIDHVDFSYVEDKPLIQDLHLSVKSGQRVAIVGPTGLWKDDDH